MLTGRGEQSIRFPIQPPDQAAKLVKPSRIEEDRSMKRKIAQRVFLGGMTGAAMLLTVGTAQAVEFKFGEANLQIDNLVSVSYR